MVIKRTVPLPLNGRTVCSLYISFFFFYNYFLKFENILFILFIGLVDFQLHE